MKKIYFLIILLVQFFISNALDLKGLIVDNDTKVPLIGALIRLQIDGKETGRVLTDAKGMFSIALERNVDYKVYVDKNGYEQTRLDISTKFSSSINDIPALDISLIKVKTTNTNVVANSTNKSATTTTNSNTVAASTSNAMVLLKGKVYHLLYGGLAGEQVILTNTNTGEIQIDYSIANGNFLFTIEANKNYSLTVKGIAGNPFYDYETYYISTLGVKGAVQIIRNFENKAIIDVLINTNSNTVNETKKENNTNNTVAINQDPVQKTVKPKKSKKDIVARNVVVKITDVNKKEEDTKALDKLAAKQKEIEIKTAEAIKLAEEKRLADQKKLDDKIKKIADNQKVVLENKETVQKQKEAEKLAAEEKLKQEQKLEADRIANEKRIAAEKELAMQKELEAKRQEKIAYNKHLDSIAGTAPRFMHKEKTKEDIAREQQTNLKESVPMNNTVITTDLMLLPIGVEESRTVIKEDKIYFGPGKAILDEAAKNYIKSIAEKLNTNAQTRVDISIHADANDEASVAEYLCKLRTKLITDLLINTYKVNFSQLTIRSVGSTQGANECKKGDVNCTELDHQMNRRIEFHFINN